MKVTATFSLKLPVPGIEYGSQGYACEIAIEPPPEIREDRTQLKKYISALYAECRQRVEEQIQTHGSEAGSGNGAPHSNGRSRRNGRPPSNGRHNGSHRAGNGAAASPKQVNYLRSLANESGLGYRGLDDLAQDEFGKTVRDLTKREASQLIEELRE